MKGRNAVFLMMAVFAVCWFASMRLYWDVYESGIRGSDFSSYYTAGLLVREGRAGALYDVAPGDSILGDATGGPWAEAGAAAGVPTQHYYIYPPAFALLFVPLSLVSFTTAMNLWLVLDVVLLGLFGALYAKSRGGDFTAPEAAFMVVTCFFEFLPLIWAMAIGQTSLLVLALLAGVLLAWRRGSDLTAGTLLGLAVALKLTPALLTIFFFWRGRRRIAWSSAMVFALVQAVSIAFLGWGVHWQFYARIVPEMSGGTAYFLNQSLGAFFNRLLTTADVTQVELVASPLSKALATAVFVALALLSARALRRETRDVPLGDEIQFGCVLLLTLLASPISWVHHYLLALPALYAVVGNLGRRGEAKPAKALLAGIAFLLIARKPHPDLFLHGALRILNSGALAGALILWGLSLAALKGSPRPGEAA
ncbi:MAG TPA: glycosyltransferase family 87 protein [Candidatus Saccharimonadales bacterium]|nr:glycosyltransferase family 87 protein [Candidatus Saccharimonadales bacterium]